MEKFMLGRKIGMTQVFDEDLFKRRSRKRTDIIQ